MAALLVRDGRVLLCHRSTGRRWCPELIEQWIGDPFNVSPAEQGGSLAKALLRRGRTEQTTVAWRADYAR